MAASENDMVVGPVVPANGVTVISLDFFFESDDQLRVFQGADPLPLTLGVDYTVAGAGSGSGTITLAVAANGTDAYSVFYVPQIARTSDLPLRGDLQTAPVNAELDRLVRAIQYLRSQVARSFRVSETSPVVGALFSQTALGRAGRPLIFGPGGDSLTVGPLLDDLVALEEAAEQAGLDAAAAALSAGSASSAAGSAAAAAGSAAASAAAAAATLAGAALKNQNLADLASIPTARTNLGLGALATQNAVTFALLAAALVVLEGEGISGNDNDSTIPTCAAVKDYVDSRTVVPVRAAANFNAIALTGTYTRTGNLVTVTMAGHGMTTSQVCLFTVQSGAATNNYSAVVTVIDANTFTYVDGASGTTSGNITRRLWIRGFANISRIIYNAVGDYTIEFFTALPSANYVVSLSVVGNSLTNVAHTAVVAGTVAGGPALKTTTQLRILTGTTNVGTLTDFSEVNVMVAI